jgi:hypothetical protein
MFTLAITGKYESGIAIAHDSAVTDKSDGVKRISSEKELNAALAQAKKNGKMPLIVAIDTSVEPFWTDSGAGRAGGSGGGHVVTITDYSPGPPAKVTIDNQWGKGARPRRQLNQYRYMSYTKQSEVKQMLSRS